MVRRRDILESSAQGGQSGWAEAGSLGGWRDGDERDERSDEGVAGSSAAGAAGRARAAPVCTRAARGSWRTLLPVPL